MINNRTYSYYMLNNRRTRPLSASPSGEVIEWCMVILPIVLGLPALYCFLAMGGVFAYLGPWLIFGATILFQSDHPLSKRIKKGLFQSFHMFKGSVLNVLLSSFKRMATNKSLSYTSSLMTWVRESISRRAHVLAQAAREGNATDKVGQL